MTTTLVLCYSNASMLQLSDDMFVVVTVSIVMVTVMVTACDIVGKNYNN